MRNILLVAVFLVGCSSSPKWVKPGATAQEMHQQDYACMQQALLMRVDHWAAQRLHASCMQANGWER